MRYGWVYLADECEDEIVDGDIAKQGKAEAYEKDQVMHEDGREPTAVQSVPKHVQLIICKVPTREAQCLVRQRPNTHNQLGVLKHVTTTIFHPLINQYVNHCRCQAMELRRAQA